MAEVIGNTPTNPERIVKKAVDFLQDPEMALTFGMLFWMEQEDC